MEQAIEDQDIEVEDAFKARRKRLLIASRTPRTQKEIEDALKVKFKGTRLDLVTDDKTWTISKDFEAMVSDPNNNKIRRREEVLLGTSGNLNMPLSDIINSAGWLLAQVNSVRAGGPGGSIIRRNG